MADDNLGTIAELLIDGIEPYPDETRRQDATRLCRLNDGKRIIRDCAVFIDASTPGVWQLLFADVLDYAGRAIFAFTGGVKKLVKKAGFFEALASLLFGVDVVLQPIARKFALFFGQKTAEVVGGPWRKILAFLIPVSTGKVKQEAITLFFDVLHARRMAALVNSSCVGFVENKPRSLRIKIHERQGILLRQAVHGRRVQRTIRSRNRG